MNTREIIRAAKARMDRTCSKPGGGFCASCVDDALHEAIRDERAACAEIAAAADTGSGEAIRRTIADRSEPRTLGAPR